MLGLAQLRPILQLIGWAGLAVAGARVVGKEGRMAAWQTWEGMDIHTVQVVGEMLEVAVGSRHAVGVGYSG